MKQERDIILVPEKIEALRQTYKTVLQDVEAKNKKFKFLKPKKPNWLAISSVYWISALYSVFAVPRSSKNSLSCSNSKKF